MVSDEHNVELAPLLPNEGDQFITEATKKFFNVRAVLDLNIKRL